MNDKPLDAIGLPHHSGSVGKHDFQQRTVTDDGYEIIPARRGVKGAKCGKCNMKFDYGQAYGYCCPHIDCPLGWR